MILFVSSHFISPWLPFSLRTTPYISMSRCLCFIERHCSSNATCGNFSCRASS